MEPQKVLGVDIGASGVKGAIVDVNTGDLLTERIRFETPQPSTPEAMAEIFSQLLQELNWKKGPIGCGFPAIIKKGVALSAANIHSAWIGVDIEKLFHDVSGCPVKVINDADAAGIAEMLFGVGQGEQGTVILITIGSGLGSALFTDGVLVRNTEFGHFYLEGVLAEHYASESARKKYNLSWEEWGERFNKYLLHLDRLMSPDLIIIGGGTSKRWELYSHLITVNTRVIPATYLNKAGAIGAAYYAYSTTEE